MSAQNKNSFVFLLLYSAVIALLLLTGLNIQTFIQNQKVLGIKTEAVSNDTALQIEENFWNDFLTQNPNYFEGWIELARLEIGGGKRDSAIQAYTKAKQLNPNSPKIKELEGPLRLP